jgi:hypothetical protein
MNGVSGAPLKCVVSAFCIFVRHVFTHTHPSTFFLLISYCQKPVRWNFGGILTWLMSSVNLPIISLHWNGECHSVYHNSISVAAEEVPFSIIKQQLTTDSVITSRSCTEF